MSKIVWNTILLDEFIELGGLTEFEEKVLRSFVKGKSRIQIALEQNVSVSTIDRCLKVLRAKYDAVQPFSLLLPTRI